MVVMPPNVAVAIELTDEERAQLEAWTRRRTSAQALAMRARIVLLAAEGLKNTEIAERLEISRNWRRRGGRALPSIGWMGSPMSRGPAGRGRSPTSRSRR